jgi:hypothetical protein
MTKFKKGDRIVYVGDLLCSSYTKEWIGTHATVRAINPDGVWVDVDDEFRHIFVRQGLINRIFMSYDRVEQEDPNL